MGKVNAAPVSDRQVVMLEDLEQFGAEFDPNGGGEECLVTLGDGIFRLWNIDLDTCELRCIEPPRRGPWFSADNRASPGAGGRLGRRPQSICHGVSALRSRRDSSVGGGASEVLRTSCFGGRGQRALAASFARIL